MDNDLISRSALLKEIEPDKGAMRGVCFFYETLAMNLEALKSMIIQAPAVDAVEVVRCKDCRHTVHSRIYPEVLICTLTKMCGETDPEFFCANGEREAQE